MASEFEEKCQRIVMSLKAKGINFLALDFDCTLISEHTGGRWGGTSDELEFKIRPFFRHLVPSCVDGGIHVAVVTFSPQTEMIKSVLVKAFPSIGNSIPVRGNDKGWVYKGGGCKDGKQCHMASAAEELSMCSSSAISRSSTLLIDDDIRNINVALRNDVWAIHFNVDDIDETIDTLMLF